MIDIYVRILISSFKLGVFHECYFRDKLVKTEDS